MKIKDIVISFDFIGAVIITIVNVYTFPYWLENAFTKEVYSIGISVLSIIFSVYFAALAVIISSSDDEFVRFLIQVNVYTVIIGSFKFTLILLFISLVYAIMIYFVTQNWIIMNIQHQPFYCYLVFIFLFSYSLLATGLSSKDALKYAQKRSEYLNLTKK